MTLPPADIGAAGPARPADRRKLSRSPHEPRESHDFSRGRDVKTFAFRVRLNAAFTDQDADRVYEAAPDEVSLQEGPKGSYVGFDREAPGQRGPGGFPRPFAGNARTHLWDWADVASWFQALPNGGPAGDDRAQTIAAVNGALANRLLAWEKPSDRDRIRAVLGV